MGRIPHSSFSRSWPRRRARRPLQFEIFNLKSAYCPHPVPAGEFEVVCTHRQAVIGVVPATRMKTFAFLMPSKRGIVWMLSMLVSASSALAEEKPIRLEDFVDIPGRETFPAGTVYGPKAAFSIRAPKGWVLDNQAGVDQGLPCVLYPEGSTWAAADAVMYAKIASTDTTDRGAFVKEAIAHMRKGNKEFKSKQVASGKTGDGHAYIINEYRHGKQEGAENSQFERVAYVQMPGAVAFIVFTTSSEKSYKKHGQAIDETVKSFTYQPKFINFGAQKPK